MDEKLVQHFRGRQKVENHPIPVSRDMIADEEKTRHADLSGISQWHSDTIKTVQRLVDEAQKECDFNVTFLLDTGSKACSLCSLLLEVSPDHGGTMKGTEGGLAFSVFYRFQIRHGLSFGKGFVPRISMDIRQGWLGNAVDISHRDSLGLKHRDVTFDITDPAEQDRFKAAITQWKDIEVQQMFERLPRMKAAVDEFMVGMGNVAEIQDGCCSRAGGCSPKL